MGEPSKLVSCYALYQCHYAAALGRAQSPSVKPAKSAQCVRQCSSRRHRLACSIDFCRCCANTRGGGSQKRIRRRRSRLVQQSAKHAALLPRGSKRGRQARLSCIQRAHLRRRRRRRHCRRLKRNRGTQQPPRLLRWRRSSGAAAQRSHALSHRPCKSRAGRRRQRSHGYNLPRARRLDARGRLAVQRRTALASRRRAVRAHHCQGWCFRGLRRLRVACRCRRSRQASALRVVG